MKLIGNIKFIIAYISNNRYTSIRFRIKLKRNQYNNNLTTGDFNMKYKLLAYLGLLTTLSSTVYATTYTQYGNTLYGSDGSSYTQYGNTVYSNNGTSYTTYGNTTYGSNGSSYTTYGNTTYGNNGTSYTTYGNTTYGSNGSSCSNYGNTTYCN